MNHNKLTLFALLLLVTITACGPARVEENSLPAPMVEPTIAPVDMGMPVPSTKVAPVPAVTEMVVTEITTHIGENYLLTNGNGDIELIRQVARSLR